MNMNIPVETLNSKDRLKRYFALVLEKYNVHPADFDEAVNDLIEVIRFNKDLDKLDQIVNQNKNK